MGAELIAAIEWTGVLNTALNLGKVALGLGFVIFVHELGHFLVAKMCGVKCEKFYIGFDIPMPFGIPSKLYRFQWGETEYGIGILPLGGYVKMLGQDDNPMNAQQEAERTKLNSEAGSESASQSVSAAAMTSSEAASSAAITPATATPAASGIANSTAAASKPVIDPRSYTAKTVPQRMAIISAGVIVNLIFAVIFAAFAYRVGVPVTPCEIGQVVPGGPAWKAGLQPNTRIVQIGTDGKKSDKLRFDWDLRQGVGLHGDEEDLVLIVRDEKGRESPISVRPVTFRRGWEKISTIGIAAESTLELLRGDKKDAIPAMDGSAAAHASPALKNHDRVVAVDGQPVASHHALTAYLAQYPDKPITLRVERPKDDDSEATENVTVVVPAQRRRSIGVIMEHAAITGIRPGSPAESAGFREGDILKTINDEPLGDPMLLPHKLRAFYGREIEVEVVRAGESQPVKLKVTPRMPQTFDWDWSVMMRPPMSTEALGLAFSMTQIVQDVEPSSPAAKAGLQSGDKLVALKAEWADKNSKKLIEDLTNAGQELKIDGEMVTWPVVDQLMQHLPEDEVLRLTYQRGNSVGNVVVAPVLSDVCQPDRGFLFAQYSEMHVASSLSEATYLGVRQTWEDATRVVGLLQKLVTGAVSVTNLGGIGSIAYVASSEASEGSTRLLIFLTMLSANLAVLNFLPIPALDGGHMMFLIYEGLFRKPVNERVQVALTIFGVVCLLGLMIFVNALDVKRFFF